MASLPLKISVARCFRRFTTHNKPSIRLNSTEITRRATLPYAERDPSPLFFNKTVQNILLKITGINLEKMYAEKQMKPSDPTYRFVTAEELEKMIDDAKKRAANKLQMPPVLKERQPINEILSCDPELKGFENQKLVFTDITYGISDRDRLIVVRDTDGTLRHANWGERDRMNQIFFPIEGRKFSMPKMFEDQYLEKVLERKEYEFVLDRACVQFEPDEPNYIRVTTTTYDHINLTKSYDALRSTRHFGPMAFYLTFYKKLDDLLIDMINRELIDDAVETIQLFYIIHEQSKQVEMDSSKQLQYIQEFAKTNCSKSNIIQIALRNYQELQEQKVETVEGIKKAHGQSE